MNEDIDNVLYHHLYIIIAYNGYTNDGFNLCRGIAEILFLAKTV